ncbi:MAG: CBS domain containing-hemolysin-like protein [Chitinophagales bacterium]|jgi:CBS domain containing-hemolysin-like protein
MVVLIIAFTASILFSFLCSIWEAVLLSITPAFIATRSQAGKADAEILKEFKKDIDRPLSAILTLNTIAHTMGAIGVGAQAGALFGENYFNILGFSLSYESIIAGVMTLCILILSEIIPKTIGANNWKSLAGFTIQSLRILLFILAPFVWLTQLMTKFLKKNKGESVLSRADFSALAQTGLESGSLDEDENSIIQNLLKLNELMVKDIMTPRIVMFTAPEIETVNEFYTKHKALRFSRIPILEKEEGAIVGMVLKDEILEELVQGRKDTTLKSLRRDILHVKDDMHLQDLMAKLTKESGHVALVNESFGSIVGLVTMEDLIETLLGIEIMDETDNVADLQELARKKWQERAKKRGLIK